MNLEIFFNLYDLKQPVYQFWINGLTQVIKNDIKDEKSKEHNNFYTCSIQDESTSSLLLSNPLRRIPLNQ